MGLLAVYQRIAPEEVATDGTARQKGCRLFPDFWECHLWFHKSGLDHEIQRLR